MIPSRKSLMLFVLLLLTTTLLSQHMATTVSAAGSLSQEKKMELPYDYIAGTDVCAGDIDGDDVVEIVSVGYGAAGAGPVQGSLGIGTWDGANTVLEKGLAFQVESMDTYAYAVDMGDLDGDDLLEIVIAGYYYDGAHWHSWLQVYRWTGTTLTLLDTETWTPGEAFTEDVAVGDLDDDGTPEIVTCGMVYDGTTMQCQLRVWSWGAGLHLEASEEWDPSSWSECYGVALGELDGEARIATASVFWDEVEGKSWGKVGVWSYGSDLTLEDSEEWDSVGDTWARGVFIDDDKIYTAGISNDGTRDRGQLRVWSSSLAVEDSEEWHTVSHTSARSVFVADVNGDGEKEVVNGGYAYDGTRDKAQLRVWSQSSPLTLEDSEEWYDTSWTEIRAVFVGDVDQDGVNEILTEGDANNYKIIQLIVWSYPDNTDPTITGLTPAAGSTANTGRPAIGAGFSDDYSGINVSSVSIKVGGTDVTASATVTATGVTYTPPSDLADGDYTAIVKVSDRSGNEATATWTFKVKILLFGLEPMIFYILVIGLIAVVLIVVVLMAMRGRKPSAPPAPAYAPPPTAPPAANCPSCGTPITPGTTFCPKCGRRIQ